MSRVINRLLKHYKVALNNHPFIVQSFQTGFLLGTGDIIAQAVIEKDKQYDITRTVRFTFIGACMGPCLHVWFTILERVFPAKSKTSMSACHIFRTNCGALEKQKISTKPKKKFDKDALKKVAIDQGFFAPFFLSIFITCNTLLEGKGVEGVKNRLKNDYPEILLANYKVWPAVQLINFGLVPLEYRVLFLQTIALAWNTYLAWKLNLTADEK